MKVLKVIGNVSTDASWKSAEGSSINDLIPTIKSGVAIATVKTGKLKIFAKDETGKLKSLCKELFTPAHVEEAKVCLLRTFSPISIEEVEEFAAAPSMQH